MQCETPTSTEPEATKPATADCDGQPQEPNSQPAATDSIDRQHARAGRGSGRGLQGRRIRRTRNPRGCTALREWLPMGKLINTLAIGSALGVGYLLFKLGNAEAAPKKSKESEKSKSANASAKPSGPAKQPTSAPKGLLREPRHPTPRQRINRSTTDEAMTVRESPTELLRQARRFDPNVSLDELTGARLAASEHGSGSFTEPVLHRRRRTQSRPNGEARACTGASRTAIHSANRVALGEHRRGAIRACGTCWQPGP